MMIIYNLILLFDFFMMNILIFPMYKKFHPLMYSMLLGIYSLMLVIKINLLFNLFWYSYILYLLMVGGIMILILYLTSISNNELFSLEFLKGFSMILKLIMNSIIIYMMFLYLNLFDMYYVNMSMDLKDMKKMIMWGLYDMNVEYMYMKIYLIIYILMYLFILMVGVTLISSIMGSPLRQLKN